MFLQHIILEDLCVGGSWEGGQKDWLCCALQTVVLTPVNFLVLCGG